MSNLSDAGLTCQERMVKYIKHSWKMQDDCKHCGMKHTQYSAKKAKLEHLFLSNQLPIKEYQAEIAKLNKCLTEDEYDIKNIIE